MLAGYTTIACIVCVSVFLPYITHHDTLSEPYNTDTPISTLPLPSPAAGTVQASVGRIIETQ